MTIGIPRALFYWKQPFFVREEKESSCQDYQEQTSSFWETFFSNLGLKIIISPPTNKEIVEKGTKVADPETCFSTKVFWGHLLWLEGKVDYIFVPRLKTDEERLEYCPKFFGLPDLAKILVKTPILTETFDWRKESFEKTLEKLGQKLGKGREEIKKAQELAFLKEKEQKEKGGQDFLRKIQSEKPKIVLISHLYNLYDDYLNFRTKEKLEKLGTQVIFIDQVPTFANLHKSTTNFKNNKIGDIYGQIRENSQDIKFHWEFGKEIMEKVREVLKYDIAGAVEISSFQCGCDAVLKEFVEKEFKSRKIPFLYLLIDEHTGEAGLQTRLEAFIDTIK